MVNNIQPRLSKIGKSLSFQNNKSISSGDNGFVLTNNDGTAANLSTGDLNSVSINASGNLKVEGHKTELDTDLVTAKDNKIFLNSKSEKELQGGGIYLGEGIGTLAFTITGLDTDTVSVHYEKSFLCSSVNITANGNLYGFDIDDCSSFFMIADGLQSNQEFTNNFEVIASGTDLIISAKTGTINVVSFLGVHNKKIEYNNGWQFNDGVTVDTHTITDSTLRVIGTESVILDTPTLLANDSYVPNQNKSLITKDYMDKNSTFFSSAGVQITGGGISITLNSVSSFNNNTFICPTFIVADETTCGIVEFFNQDSIFSIDKKGLSIQFKYMKNPVYVIESSLNQIIKPSLQITGDKMYLYNGGTLLQSIDIGADIQFNEIVLLNFDNDGDSLCLCDTFTWIHSSNVSIERGIAQKSYQYSTDLSMNITFDKAYDSNKLLDTTYNYMDIRTSGVLKNLTNMPDSIIIGA